MKLSDIVVNTPKTELLYFRDSYLKEFQAKVLRAVREQGRSWYLILEQSAFHPKGGGQPSDTGKLLFPAGSAQVKKDIFDHCINQTAGRVYRTMGSWLGDPKPYVDYAGEPPSGEVIAQAQGLANTYIKEALSVSIDFLDKSKIHSVSDAPNIERLPENDVYRVVRINGFESIPCGGTHVKATSEIGGIKTLGVEAVSGGFRVYFDVE